ncbi:hypothetical protein [Gloeobacter kilaueensis]|uniref:Beta-fructosidases (Levanase/invertase) n=1 Tax=Gloeobacter kilaueensis (strain ATCC BAA-2537 / CCAP 1431/1 / ULC 316 / JS1) TaxID=1183438 RepID=U5QJK5_GLOK1|nr:hypothetical protein [Gloeobacter kilaueensis]AGY59068.1 beta-fructosidases (levanase/invertase) [Gloeobacter kilaueensis JS1]
MPTFVVRLLLGLVWIAFGIYAFFLAPAETQTPQQLVQSLTALALGQGEPLVVSLFNLMGLIPLLYLFLLIPDGHGQKLPAWPFGLAAFAVGAFALLPYLILRQPHHNWPTRKPAGWLVRIFDSRWLVLLTAVGIGWFFYNGLTHGDWAAFAAQWHASRFVHVMSLDFVVSTALLPVLIPDDLYRRNSKQIWPLWLAAAVPLVGPIAYLLWRPSLFPREGLD